MSSENYSRHYSILGVFQDDDWETIRSAYKRQIRRWHPDRFQDPDQRQIAESKCKDINLAYQSLDDYYQKNGSLPPDETQQPLANTDTSAGSDIDSESAGTMDVTEPHAFETHETPQGSGRLKVAGIILICTAFVVSYLLSDSVISTDSGSGQYRSDDLRFDHNPVNSASMTEKDASLPASSESGYAPGALDPDVLKEQLSEKRLEANKAMDIGRLPYITEGSTKQHVLAIQGKPSRQTETAWDYGLSRINFKDGRVTGWYENPMDPLAVRH